MHRYIPNTDAQQADMLHSLGLDDAEALFADISKSVRRKRPLNIPGGLSELELIRHMRTLAQKNTGVDQTVCFLGAGAYDHYIPAVIDHMLLRQEFYTAYTPYQPEISQGTLQAIFEYQSIMCELTGLDVANASMYDGATALAEAAIMASHAKRKSEILVSDTVHPQSRAVLRTYCEPRGIRIRIIPHTNGRMDIRALKAAISVDTAAIIVQNPNFFGIVEDIQRAADRIHESGGLMIVSVDPISLGILKPPGEMGADIAVGDGQSLGVPLSFGGPYVGFMTAKQKLLRSMPGRIVGATTDTNGQRAYVLTMQTREQHIRRERATSNICTNNALVALTNTIYLTIMGKQGITEVARQCLSKAHYAHERLIETNLFTPLFDASFFKEFALKSTIPVDRLNKKLLSHGILGGYDVQSSYPQLENGWLVAVTEKRTRAQIDTLVERAVEARP